jgi:hypothetical protein
MALQSDLFYDPFADRDKKLEGLDFKFARDREPKKSNGNGGIGGNNNSGHDTSGNETSGNEDDSRNDDDDDEENDDRVPILPKVSNTYWFKNTVITNICALRILHFCYF